MGNVSSEENVVGQIINEKSVILLDSQSICFKLLCFGEETSKKQNFFKKLLKWGENLDSVITANYTIGDSRTIAVVNFWSVCAKDSLSDRNKKMITCETNAILLFFDSENPESLKKLDQLYLKFVKENFHCEKVFVICVREKSYCEKRIFCEIEAEIWAKINGMFFLLADLHDTEALKNMISFVLEKINENERIYQNNLIQL